MKKPIFYFFVGVLVTLGIIAIIVFVDMFRFMPWSGVQSNDIQNTIVTTIASPDSEYAATLYNSMGGGAAGSCNQGIEINSKDSPFNIEKLKSEFNTVFTASCGSNLEMKWLGERELNISYTVGGHGVSIFQSFHSKDRKVNITYTPIELHVAP